MRRRIFAISGIVMASSLGALSCAPFVSASTTKEAGHANGSLPIGTSSSRVLRFHRNGSPNLRGLSIPFVNGAGSAHVADAHIYVLNQYLKAWGATASFINTASGPGGDSADLDVASGNADFVVSNMPEPLDAGLTLFGPNQKTLDLVLLVKKGITSIKQLRGKTIALANQNSQDYLLTAIALKGVKLTLSDMHTIITGGSTADFDELVAGKVDAAWAHISDASSAGPNFKILTTAAKASPTFADSFMAAKPSWLRSNPAIAEAIDLAWLASAKQFDTNENAWIQSANSYTSGTNSLSVLKQNYVQLKRINGWPLSASDFTRQLIATNYVLSKQQAAIAGLGVRPLAKLVDLTPWNDAWAVFSANEHAY